MGKKADELSPEMRAEDIILGSLGYGEEASIIAIERTPDGFQGVGKWKDGEQFQFQNEDELTELEGWALDILSKMKKAM